MMRSKIRKVKRHCGSGFLTTIDSALFKGEARGGELCPLIECEGTFPQCVLRGARCVKERKWRERKGKEGKIILKFLNFLIPSFITFFPFFILFIKRSYFYVGISKQHICVSLPFLLKLLLTQENTNLVLFQIAKFWK